MPVSLPIKTTPINETKAASVLRSLNHPQAFLTNMSGFNVNYSFDYPSIYFVLNHHAELNGYSFDEFYNNINLYTTNINLDSINTYLFEIPLEIKMDLSRLFNYDKEVTLSEEDQSTHELFKSYVSKILTSDVEDAIDFNERPELVYNPDKEEVTNKLLSGDDK